jgi:hypothetical protein
VSCTWNPVTEIPEFNRNIIITDGNFYALVVIHNDWSSLACSAVGVDGYEFELEINWPGYSSYTRAATHWCYAPMLTEVAV